MRHPRVAAWPPRGDERRGGDRLGARDLPPAAALRGLVSEVELGDPLTSRTGSTPAPGSSTSTLTSRSAETYATRDALAAHYGLEFERFAGISLAEQEAEHGPVPPGAAHPDACCGVRKVEPMTHGPRRDGLLGLRHQAQPPLAESGRGLACFGWDRRFGLWKLNPLADWTDEADLGSRARPGIFRTTRCTIRATPRSAAPTAPCARARTTTSAPAAGPRSTRTSAASTSRAAVSCPHRSGFTASRYPRGAKTEEITNPNLENEERV